MASYLERFFGKARPDEITYDDFLAFHQQGVEEHQHLEYKPRGMLVRQDDTIIKPQPGRPHDIVGFSELAKSVSGFANAEGGLLVLGVKEEAEKHKGTVVKVRPGEISALPINVTREMIENRLIEKIQFHIDGIRIVPLRSSPTSSGFVYLIDVPQSIRPPHRVDELYYFQRYNFSTLEMKHFQIADLFGKRLVPDLAFDVVRVPHHQDGNGAVQLTLTLHNRGRAVAKYVISISHRRR